MPSVIELLTRPEFFAKSVLKNKEVQQFASNQAQMQHFFSNHLSPYVLGRCFSHPLLRVQLLAHLKGQDLQGKSVLATLLFQPMNTSNTLEEATWLGAIAYLADGDDEFMNLLDGQPFRQRIETDAGRYYEDPNFYFATLLFESFFRRFRTPQFKLSNLDHAATQKKIDLPDCTRAKGSLCSLHFKNRPWCMLDFELPSATNMIVSNYVDSLHYYFDHFDELHADHRTPQQLVDIATRFSRHYSPKFTSTQKIEIIFKHLEKCIKLFDSKRKGYKLCDLYFYKLFLYHGISLLNPNTPFVKTRALFIELLGNHSVFNYHFGGVEYASHQIMQNAMIDYFKSGDSVELNNFIDDVEANALTCFSTGESNHSVLFVLQNYSSLIRNQTRHNNILMHGVLAGYPNPSTDALVIMKTFVTQTMTIALTDIAKSVLIFQNVLDKLKAAPKQFHTLSLMLLFEKCGLYSNQENIRVLKKLFIENEVNKKEIYKLFKALLADKREYHKPDDAQVLYLRHELTIYDPLSEMEDPIEKFLLEFLKDDPDHYLFEALHQLATGYIEYAVAKLQLLTQSQDKAKAERALHELTALTLSGVIGYEDELEISKKEGLSVTHKNCIRALLHVTHLDFTDSATNRALFNNLMDLLCGLEFWAIPTFKRSDNSALQTEVVLPHKVAKNIYHFFHRLELAGEVLPRQLKLIKHQYVEQLEKNCAEASLKNTINFF